jgi:zinc transporter ZupT
MVKEQPSAPGPSDPQFERMFIERERNRFANRALSLLVVLNGAAALVLLTIMAQAPESTLDRKLAAAMMFFSGGAMAALLSSFLAYVNRTVRMEGAARSGWRRVLRGFAVAAVIGSGAAFLVGMNMVGTISAEKSSSHPKGSREDKPSKPTPIEKV